MEAQHVVKRDGRQQELKVANVTKRVDALCKGLDANTLILHP